MDRVPIHTNRVQQIQHLSSALCVWVLFVKWKYIHFSVLIFCVLHLSFFPFPPIHGSGLPPREVTTFISIQEPPSVCFIPLSSPPLPSPPLLVPPHSILVAHPTCGFFFTSTSNRIDEYVQRFMDGGNPLVACNRVSPHANGNFREEKKIAHFYAMLLSSGVNFPHWIGSKARKSE